MKKVLVFGMTNNPGGMESVIMNYYRHIDHSKIQFDFIIDKEVGSPYLDEIVSLGGNVQTYGNKPDQSEFKVGIEDPFGGSEYVGILQIKNKTVITSGGYERFFEKDGITYHHIINPKTGYPAESGLKSVSIVNENGTMADGLSTALFVMGKEKAIKYWEKNGREGAFDIILVEDDGTVYISKGLEEKFTSKRDIQVIK